MIEDLPTFDDVKNLKLQAYNRMMTFLNTCQDASQGLAKAYLNALDDFGKTQVLLIKKEIEIHGIERVKQDIIKGHRVFEERIAPV